MSAISYTGAALGVGVSAYALFNKYILHVEPAFDNRYAIQVGMAIAAALRESRLADREALVAAVTAGVEKVVVANKGASFWPFGK